MSAKSKSNAPINLLHLNTASKLSYWIKHLPYHKLNISKQAQTSLELEIMHQFESELSLAQQMADIFYGHCLSGCTINKWTKQDYQEMLHCYKDTLDLKHQHIQYVLQLIHESQQYYKKDANNNDDRHSHPLRHKNWMTDTYNIYVLNINEMQSIMDCQPEQDYKNNENNEKNENYAGLGLSIAMPSEDVDAIYPKQLFIKSPTKKWRACHVVAVLDNGKLKIRYNGFSSKHDEIVDAKSQRLTTNKPDNVIPKQSKLTPVPNSKQSKPSNINKLKDTRIWVQSPSNNKLHRECKIFDEKENEFKIHFISYHEKHDMWIDKASPFIKSMRPLGNVLAKGDNLSCFNEQFKAWLEIEVLVVDTENNRVWIGWIGSNDLKPKWLPINSNKLSIKHKKQNAPAPYSSQ